MTLIFVSVIKGPLLQEVRQVFSNWVSQVFKERKTLELNVLDNSALEWSFLLRTGNNNWRNSYSGWFRKRSGLQIFYQLEHK